MVERRLRVKLLGFDIKMDNALLKEWTVVEREEQFGYRT
jgi:hypothetical protein